MSRSLLTTTEVGSLFGIADWRIRRVIDRGLYPRPEKAGPAFLFEARKLPVLAAVLVEAGYMERKQADTALEALA